MRRIRPAHAVVAWLFAVGLVACSDEPERPKRQQVVRLLPDTPPPPPPPPKPEDKPPPKPPPDTKPQQQETPKPVEAPPLPQALKSDEAAGDGPGNGLTAGTVTQDYAGQPIGSGTTIGGGKVDDGAERFAAMTYANAATRALNEFLQRDRDVKQLDYKVRVQLWLQPDGEVQRVELVGSTGDERTDRALREALQRFPGASTRPPATLPQPLRLLVSNRMLG